MIESLNLIPYVGVGAIKFGESREEVRKNLGTYKEYKKNKFSTNTLDDFGFCQVFYNAMNKVEAVEMYRNVGLVYDNVNLFLLDKPQLLRVFQADGINEDEYGINVPSLGLSIALTVDMPDSILAYQKGYM